MFGDLTNTELSLSSGELLEYEIQHSCRAQSRTPLSQAHKQNNYYRTNTTLETLLANWISHEYTSAIWQLQHTTDLRLTGRAKRNILGDFIGGVTGLVTSEQLTVEHKELKETESRVEKILNHQINLEKLMDEMSRDMVNKSGVIAALQNLRIRMEYNAVFQTKKVKN